MYKESHRFPSGLEINFDTELNYSTEIRSLNSAEDILNHVNRWMYLDVSLRNCLYSIPCITEIKFFLEDFDYQKEVCDKARTNPSFQNLLNLTIPPTILKCEIISEHYNVPMGTTILQLWNAGKFFEKDGFWYLKG